MWLTVGMNGWTDLKEEEMGEPPVLDPFADDEPIVASCDLENPESCESCQ